MEREVKTAFGGDGRITRSPSITNEMGRSDSDERPSWPWLGGASMKLLDHAKS
jgi:hypothetical protein